MTKIGNFLDFSKKLPKKLIHYEKLYFAQLLKLEAYISLLLAAMLITPVVLYRMIQVIAEGVIQPVVVEQECQQRANRSEVDIGDVIVISVAVNHQDKFHDE